MGRESWLEPLFGMDKLAVFHRYNGFIAISLMLVHVVLLSLGYSMLAGEFVLLSSLPYVPLAVVSLTLFITLLLTTIYIVRTRLKFETWYAVHLMAYAAIALLPFHQLTNGGDLLSSQLFATYWIGLYAFVALNLSIWRFARPIWRFFRFDFTVEKVVPEAPRATSVYISGRKLAKFKARGGQFVLVRFLAPGMWWQEHPFSLSQLPNDKHLRLTIRQLGDFTNQIPFLKPGTKAIISGPHGAFTSQQDVRNRALYIAGGIGITPIRSMLEERAKSGDAHDAVMLYGNRNLAEIIFKDELETLAEQLNMSLHHVLGDEPKFAGEKGYIDAEKIVRLVPDVTKRDVYLCGPPPMMMGVLAALEKLGVPKNQIHFERFQLHVSK